MRSLDMKYSVLMPVYRKENPFYFYRAAAQHDETECFPG